LTREKEAGETIDIHGSKVALGIPKRIRANSVNSSKSTTPLARIGTADGKY